MTFYLLFARRIIINNQYIRDLSFENPNAPYSLIPSGKQPQIDINFNVTSKKVTPPDVKEEDKDKDHLAEVSLIFKAVAKVDDNNSVFYAGIHSTGVKTGFLRSTDGITWTELTKPTNVKGTWERVRVSIAKSNTNVVWFLIAGSQLTPSTQLYKYDHSTTTYTDLTSKLPALGGNVGDFNTQDSYNMVMAVKPDDEVIAAMNTQLRDALFDNKESRELLMSMVEALNDLMIG